MHQSFAINSLFEKEKFSAKHFHGSKINQGHKRKNKVAFLPVARVPQRSQCLNEYLHVLFQCPYQCPTILNELFWKLASLLSKVMLISAVQKTLLPLTVTW